MKRSALANVFAIVWCGAGMLLGAGGARAQEAPAAEKPAAEQPAAEQAERASTIPNAGEFQKLSTELSYDRAHSLETLQKTQDAALALLDGLALAELNRGATPDVAGLNARLATLVSQKAGGESYRVMSAGGQPAVYLLAVNFGDTGPSAVRVYAKSTGAYRLAGKIDRFSDPDIFDDFLVLAVLEKADGVFVTVTGRTDELSTGMFGAWRYGEKGLEKLWLSDLLVHSSYQLLADGLQVTYCGEPSDEDPAVCHKMVMDHDGWNGKAWRRISQVAAPATAK